MTSCWRRHEQAASTSNTNFAIVSREPTGLGCVLCAYKHEGYIYRGIVPALHTIRPVVMLRNETSVSDQTRTQTENKKNKKYIG